MNKEERTITSDFKKHFNINIDEIQPINGLIEQIAIAIAELKDKATYNRLEVILNKNLISTKDIFDNYRTILGCRVSYEDLENNISFILREDKKPSYEILEQENKQLKEQINKIKQVLDNQIDYREFADIVNEIDEILKGENNE